MRGCMSCWSFFSLVSVLAKKKSETNKRKTTKIHSNSKWEKKKRKCLQKIYTINELRCVIAMEIGVWVARCQRQGCLKSFVYLLFLAANSVRKRALHKYTHLFDFYVVVFVVLFIYLFIHSFRLVDMKKAALFCWFCVSVCCISTIHSIGRR